jgi:hypothetical protein
VHPATPLSITPVKSPSRQLDYAEVKMRPMGTIIASSLDFGILPTIYHSPRNASTGETRLLRRAGTRQAINADNPSAATATDVTEALNGFTP